MDVGVNVNVNYESPILNEILRESQYCVRLLERILRSMSSVSDSLDALTAAVDAVGVRFAELAATLPQALADRDAAQVALAAAQANDATDAATISDLQAQLNDAQANLDGVVSSISVQTAELNALGTPVVVES